MVYAPSGAFPAIRRMLSATTWRSRVAFGAIVAAGLSVAATDAGVQATALSLVDPSAILAGRSPGVRAPGALFQTKTSARSRRSHVAGPPPRSPVERILPVASVPAAEIVDDLPMPPLDGGSVSVGMVPPPLEGVPASWGQPPVGFVPVFGSPGGGGGGAGQIPPVFDTPPVSAVPEPATWATTIVGFGLVGAFARRRRSRPRRIDLIPSVR